MQDRFKFRAFITCNICIGVEEEKEISFYIYDVAVYSNGDIGFSRDDLLNALSKLDLTQAQNDEIEEEISENSYCDDYEWYSIEFGKKEQCTGLKDKNGKLIFDGDIFKSPQGIYTIAVDDFGLWTVLDKLGNVAEWSDFVKNYLFDEDNKQIEVIGNIHENSELLEKKER